MSLSLSKKGERWLSLRQLRVATDIFIKKTVKKCVFDVLKLNQEPIFAKLVYIILAF